MEWQKLLLTVQWCHDALTIIELVGMGVLLGVVITIAILTWQSDRQWRIMMIRIQKQLQDTQTQIGAIQAKIAKHHPESTENGRHL